MKEIQQIVSRFKNQNRGANNTAISLVQNESPNLLDLIPLESGLTKSITWIVNFVSQPKKLKKNLVSAGF